MFKWSETYHGVSHLGTPNSEKRTRWATVVIWEKFTELTCWISGMGFNQPQYIFHGEKSEKTARQAGENWIKVGNLPEESGVVIKFK